MSAAPLRQELEDLIRRDLSGPAGGEQEIVTEQSVRNRYLLGMLAPLKLIEADEEPFEELADGSEDNAEEGTAEPSTPAKRGVAPSTFGLSFCLDLAVLGRCSLGQRPGSLCLALSRRCAKSRHRPQNLARRMRAWIGGDGAAGSGLRMVTPADTDARRRQIGEGQRLAQVPHGLVASSFSGCRRWMQQAMDTHRPFRRALSAQFRSPQFEPPVRHHRHPIHDPA